MIRLWCQNCRQCRDVRIHWRWHAR